jgi:hypothetical protein
MSLVLVSVMELPLGLFMMVLKDRWLRWQALHLGLFCLGFLYIFMGNGCDL